MGKSHIPTTLETPLHRYVPLLACCMVIVFNKMTGNFGVKCNIVTREMKKCGKSTWELMERVKKKWA